MTKKKSVGIKKPYKHLIYRVLVRFVILLAEKEVFELNNPYFT